MRLPVRAWRETLASLGFIRTKKAASKVRGGRKVPLQFEPLEDRRLMATTLYWDPTASLGAHLGGAGTWDTASDLWYNPSTNADVAWNNANGDKAVFSGTAGIVTVSSGIATGEVDFTTSAYNLASGSLAISGSGGVDVAAGLTDTISSTLTGSNGLSVTDTGTLVASGTNTFTGDTSVSAGTLQLGNDAALSSGSVSVSSGATLDLNGANPTIAGLSGAGTITNSAQPAEDLYGDTIPSSALTVGSGDISSTFSGTLQDGTGGINLTKIGAGTLTLSGASTYSGATAVSAGTLLAGSTDALSANSAYEVDGTLNLGGSNQSIGSLWGTGTVQSTGSANVTLTTGNDGSDSLFSGVIQDGASSGSLTLEVAGAGTTALSGTNTYSGGTTVDAGATLQFGDGTASNGSIAGDITDSGTVQFANATAQTFGASITGDGDLSVTGPGTLTIDTSIAAAGEVTVSAGATLQAGSANVLNPSSLIDVGGTFDLNGYDQTVDGLSGESGGQVTLGSATLTIDGSDNGSTTFSGVISGTGNLHKLGTDTLVLTAANTYMGQTIIDDGAIVLGENNHSILNAPTDGAGPVNPVDLTYDFNTVGVTSDGTGTTTGGLDGSGSTLSGHLLGSSQTWNGNSFTLGAPDMDNAIVASGQDIDLASVPLSQIQILATAMGGNQPAQAFTVNYTDGSSTTYTQYMSGWTSPQGYTGESVALTMAYTNQANGSANDQPVNVYGYTFAVDATKSVASVTLPDNANVVVLAIDTVSPTDIVTNLDATPTSSNTIHLSWTEPSGTVAGYDVFRGQSSGGELTLLNSSPLAAATTTFDDTTVVPGNQYYYVVQALSPTNSGPSVETNLSTSFNLTGITSDGTTFTGGLDGGGEALSGTLLGSSQTWNGQSFTLGTADQPDVVKAAGQTIALSPGYYASLNLLMTATNGNQPAQTFTVNYTDGTSTTFTQGVSDWYSPQGYSGESVAVTMAYRNNADGTEDGRTFHVYGYQFALDSGKAIASITLPNNGNVFLLAATAETAGPLSNETSATTPTTGSTAQADLSSAFNHAGITADGATFTTGGLDGGGTAFSGTQLGTRQTWNGTNFAIGAAGSNDVVQAAGLTVALPSGQYSQLNLLMTATNGDQVNQTFTVNYSDGSSTTLTQSVSDWFTPQGYAGESIAVATPYRNVSNGATDNRTFNLYGYTFNLDSSKTVVSITLPTNSNLFLFAAAEHAQNILPTGGSVEINGDGLLSLNGTDQAIGSLSGSGGTVSLNGATLTIGGDNTSTTYAGTITGAGNVVKTGSGTFTLAASSNYTGTTTVAAGTLQAGADSVFDPESDYILDSILDLAGFSESIGSLSGNGFVTNGGGSLATLSTGGDNASTTFSGSLQDGAGAQLGLEKLGTGNFTLSGVSNFSGPTEVASGLLEVDNSELATMVTLDAGATLQGNGGVQGVVNLGGTEIDYLYDVSITTPLLQRGSTADASTGSIALRSGETGTVLAMSEMDAAFKELLGSANNTITGQTYSTDNQTNLVNGTEPSRPAFIYDSSFSAPGVSYTGQALALEDLDGLPTSDYDYNDDYFQITVTRDTIKPIAKPDTYQDGVGGELSVGAAKGLLANDTSQDGGALSVYSVNGDFEQTVDDGKGTLEWNADGSFTYTPDYGFYGTDTFTYDDADTVSSGGSGSPTTTYSVPTTITFQVLLPTIDLLDDGNNSGSITAADESVKDTGTGAIMLADNGSLGGSVSANASYLAQQEITLDANHVFASSSDPLPYNLQGWTLTLTATNSDGAAQIFDSNMNELDGASTGKVSWNLDNGWGNVPTSVYVAAQDPQTIEWQLALVGPSSGSSGSSGGSGSTSGGSGSSYGGAASTSTAATSNDKTTAQVGELIAPQILDNQTNHSLPRGLQVTQGAFVPLNNEDDTYVGVNPGQSPGANNQLQPDMAQSGPIANDQFLLPLFISGSSANGDYYQLDIPSTIRVWANPDRTGEISDFQSLTLGDNGRLEVWVEGIAVGSSTLKLLADLDGNEAVVADSLKITVFKFTGAQDVPGLSTYKYAATGGLAGSTNGIKNSGFVGVSQSNGTSDGSMPALGIGTSLTTITWSNKPVVGRVEFQAAPDYVWDYSVNVVQMSFNPVETINGPMLATAGANGPKQVGGVGGSINSGGDVATAMNANVAVTMVGPEVNGKMAGVGFMTVGYIQNITSLVMSDTYTNLSNVNDLPRVLNNSVVAQLGGKPMLDLSTKPGSGLPTGTVPWTDSLNKDGLAGDLGKPVIPFPLLPPSEGHLGILTTHDTPNFVLPPPAANSVTVREPLPGGAGQRQATLSLTHVDVIWNFTLFVAGMSMDSTAIEGTATNSAVFTAFDSGTWVFNGSGTMNNGVWSPQTGTGVFTTKDFAVGVPSVAVAGMITKKPLYNAILRNISWAVPT